MSRLALLLVVVSSVCGTVADAQMGTRYDDPPSGNGLLRNDYEGSAGTLPPLGNPPAGNVPVGTSPSATNPEAQGPAAGSAYQSTTQGAAASPSTSAATAGASSLPNQMASRPATSQEAETIMAAAL